MTLGSAIIKQSNKKLHEIPPVSMLHDTKHQYICQIYHIVYRSVYRRILTVSALMLAFQMSSFGSKISPSVIN